MVSEVHDAGLEVQHEENLRAHYALTLAAWSRNLVEHWDGRASPRSASARPACGGSTWPASRLSFERNELQLHQVLATRTTARGVSSYPLRPDWT